MLFLIEQKEMRNKVPIHFSYVGTKLQISHPMQLYNIRIFRMSFS